jgi:phosphoribosyl 1,2-cyclic phosphate phosphodiesterase
MRVVLLGTGGSAGVPLIGGPDGSGDWGDCDPKEPRNRRTRASIMIEAGAIESEAGQGGNLLIDTAPDLRAQLLACRIPRIDAILYTHAHADHITGIDDVRVLNRIAGRPLEAFGTNAALGEITTRFQYAFRPWKPPGFFRPVLEARIVTPGDTVTMAGMRVKIFAQDHGAMVSLGLRIGRFAYSTDVARFDDAAFAALAGVDTWVLGCFTRSTPPPSHANLARALEWAARIGARRTILTHMGTEMDFAWLQKNLPPGVEPGHDGMALDIPD